MPTTIVVLTRYGDVGAVLTDTRFAASPEVRPGIRRRLAARASPGSLRACAVLRFIALATATA